MCAVSNFIYADGTKKSEKQTIYLTKYRSNIPNAPRAPFLSQIKCFYTSEYIELEIPIGIEYVDVTIEDDGSIVWFGTLTPNDNIASIPLFDGEYEISCTTNDEQIFYGILNL